MCIFKYITKLNGLKFKPCKESKYLLLLPIINKINRFIPILEGPDREQTKNRIIKSNFRKMVVPM